MKRGILLLFALFMIVMGNSLVSAAPSQEAIEAYNHGVDLAIGGNFSEALESIDHALALDQNFTLAWITKAGILNVMGEFDQSLLASDQALALDQGQAEAWTNRASALISLGRDEEALEAADKAIELDPRLSEAWMDRATALSNLGRSQEAEEAMQMAMFLIEEPGAATVPPTPTVKSPLYWFLAPLSLASVVGYSILRIRNRQ